MLELFATWAIEVVLICSFTNGLKLVSGKDMLLEKFSNYFLKKKPKLNVKTQDIEEVFVWSEIIRKPLIGCIYCMPSIWGTIIYWSTVSLATNIEWWHLPMWAVTLFSASYFQLYFHKAVEKFQA